MTNQEIKSALELRGIKTSGVYSEIVDTVYNAIETSRQFGYHYWLERTTCGKAIRGFVFDAVTGEFECDASEIDLF